MNDNGGWLQVADGGWLMIWWFLIIGTLKMDGLLL